MHSPPWAFRPDLRRPEFDDEAAFVDILARFLRAAAPARRGGRRRHPGAGWSVVEDEVWLIVGPAGVERRDQGWKLHVSATVASGRSVLARVLPILLERRCHFKFAKSLRQLEILNGVGCAEGLSGKFLTVYPDDDERAVELARLLDEATAGLDGPRILSDRPIRPGSLVHARYGAFRARTAFTPYGLLQPVIARPDGALEEDRRLGRFAPPDWAVDPFVAIRPVESGGATPSRSPENAGRGGPRIGGYRVEAALKRSNRGGTYRARMAGGAAAGPERVILKEARPHVATDRFGRDARDRLRHEDAILRAVAAWPGGGPAPRSIELFHHGGHLFLAREFLVGSTLRSAVRRRYDGGATALEPDLRAICRGLAVLVGRFHDAGLVLRDLNPNNLLVLAEADDGEPRYAIVDLDLAHDLSDDAPPFRGTTLAYASPQQEDDLAPAFADDVFAFGATLAFVATASDPFFLPDDVNGRSYQDKLEERLALHRTPRWLTDLILRCVAPAPDDRPAAADLLRAVGPRRRAAGRAARRTGVPALPGARHLLEAVDGVVDYLAAARVDGPDGRLWPATAFGGATDPRCLAHGSAGVGLFLLLRHRLDPGETTAALLDDVIATTESVPAVEGERPGGLYYGQAGVAWFLAEAAEVLDRPALARRGAALLAGVPTAGVSPEIMAGTAGLGLAAVRLFLATGDAAMRERVVAAARALQETAEPSPRGPVWRVPAQFAVDLQSKTYPGYAYGLAGIATFLLSAAAVTGGEQPADLARDALAGLLAWRHERDGRRWWPTSSHATTGSPCWLKGVAGIGAGLVRAYRLTGEPVYRETALECWRLLRPAPRHGPLTQLHGLAGIGEFFLDLADLLGEEEARADAWDIARTIYAARVDRRASGFGLCFPDEDGLAGADLMTGTVGIASFLLRLARRTPRLVMLDDVPARDEPPPVATFAAASVAS